ncbi:SRPBCC family protein [Aurantiacibacter luteus]|uniref:Polyketide cyclase n=1 Tax=Aurantiacibacter luteus TaxID=1581420 RepID=A0A0G9MZ89_9SPHN|nr:SRPBCC domain-containing protein [Aurantiacibacter luteus]KLE35864.1 hypothetical protein AAW00_05750 [Aurantiacibacter luteus]
MHAAIITIAALGLLVGAPAAAEVVASGEGGFATRDSVTVAAPREAVWDVLVHPSLYWNPQHSWYGEADRLFLSLGPGGCFCEIVSGDPENTTSPATFVEHARVIRSVPGEMLRLSGAFGPLQGEALTGTLTVELEADGEGTRIEWTYVVGGYSRFALPEVAPVVDMVMSEQMNRLAAAVAAGGAAASE